jgi:hypothetical protein
MTLGKPYIQRRKLDMLKKEQYNEMEFKTSNERPQRPSSEDIIDLMRLAVETNDKEWYDELCQKYNSYKVTEELMKAELGFIG